MFVTLVLPQKWIWSKATSSWSGLKPLCLRNATQLGGTERLPSLQYAHLQVAHPLVDGDADIMGVASQCEVYAAIADAKVLDADLLQRGWKRRRGKLEPILLSVNG